MSIRFYRRIRLTKGITLNISKSGFSISFGRRGFHITFGKNGIRITTGIPGTGVYSTKQIDYKEIKSKFKKGK
ncbi:DUF4236 domain-containing protein [Hippea alviniae]|uniref:DUF4236 domain-containing protein n=1 Tax=Hippea alviniae TaxID=1279027 RepID=UPI0003B50254|nr:DUF4236 domain-containing protein [Hippea alviniae]